MQVVRSVALDEEAFRQLYEVYLVDLNATSTHAIFVILICRRGTTQGMELRRRLRPARTPKAFDSVVVSNSTRLSPRPRRPPPLTFSTRPLPRKRHGATQKARDLARSAWPDRTRRLFWRLGVIRLAPPTQIRHRREFGAANEVQLVYALRAVAVERRLLLLSWPPTQWQFGDTRLRGQPRSERWARATDAAPVLTANTHCGDTRIEWR